MDKDFENLKAELLKNESISNLEKVERAYIFAKQAHKWQKRKSWEDYIIHPVAVAIILSSSWASEDLICASILHDTIEDWDSPKDIEEFIYNNFWENILFLVKSMSKDDSIFDKDNKHKAYFEQIKKISEIDSWLLLLKMADLIHNISTISFLKKEKQEKWIQELENDYLPFFSDFFYKMPTQSRFVYWNLIKETEVLLFNFYKKG